VHPALLMTASCQALRTVQPSSARRQATIQPRAREQRCGPRDRQRDHKRRHQCGQHEYREEQSNPRDRARAWLARGCSIQMTRARGRGPRRVRSALTLRAAPLHISDIGSHTLANTKSTESKLSRAISRAVKIMSSELKRFHCSAPGFSTPIALNPSAATCLSLTGRQRGGRFRLDPSILCRKSGTSRSGRKRAVLPDRRRIRQGP